MTHLDARIESLIDRIEAGETIDHDREIVLAGWDFLRDSLAAQRAADEQLATADVVNAGNP